MKRKERGNMKQNQVKKIKKVIAGSYSCCTSGSFK